MEILPVLFWVFVVLGVWGNSPLFPAAARPFAGAFCLLLVIILGLRVFPINVH